MDSHGDMPCSSIRDQVPTCASQPDTSKRQDWNTWDDNGDLAKNIGNHQGCPNTRQIAYIGVATDCNYTASFDSADDVYRHISSVVRTTSVVFENSFNISLSVRNVSISDAQCPESVSEETTEWNAPCSVGDLNSRFRRFSAWRDSIDDDENAYWTLFTGCKSPSDDVGVSWIGELCSSAGANIVARTQLEWQIFA
ncbi:hypothetical protein PHISP_01828 [Aspergillus sp. HF37]|nr:hypothetical protein PHISP_01828 [Aspergillus sp. HF37]